MKKLFCLLISVIAFSVFGAVMVSADGGEAAERQSNVFNKLNSISDTDIVAVSASDLVGARHFLSDSLGKIYFSSSIKNYGYLECYPIEETTNYESQVDCTYYLRMLTAYYTARDFHGADAPYFEVSLSSDESQLIFAYKYFKLSGNGQIEYTYTTSMPNISTIYVTKFAPTFTKPLVPNKEFNDLQEPFKEPTDGYTDDGEEPPKPSDYIGKDNDGDGDVDWIDMILAPILCVIDTIKFYLEKVRAFIKGFADTLYIIFKQMFVPREDYFNHRIDEIKVLFNTKFPFVESGKDLITKLNAQISVGTGATPVFNFTVMGTDCKIDFSFLNPYIDTIRAVIGIFLIIGTAMFFIRSIPGFVSGLGGLNPSSSSTSSEKKSDVIDVTNWREVK